MAKTTTTKKKAATSKTTKKVVKKKAAGKPAKKKTPQASNGSLSKNQTRILEALKKAKGESTFGDIRVVTGIQRGLTKLISAESSKGQQYPASLEANGYVKRCEPQGEGNRARIAWVITAKGSKAV